VPPADPRPDLVVFSDDWGRRPSAPQHLGWHLARDRTVLWVEPAGLRQPRPTRADVARGLQKLRGFLPGGAPKSNDPWLPTPATLHRLVPPVVPAYAVPAVRAANDALVARAVRGAMAEHGIERPVVVTSIPTMAGVLGRLGEVASVYLRMDDFTLWPGYDHAAIAEREAALLAAVDAVVAPSLGLLEVPHAQRLLVPHGVDAAHFAPPGTSPSDAPADPLADVPRPRALVAGRLDERLDGALLRGLLAREDLHLVLLGEPVALPSALQDHPRVHLRPAVPYEHLPRWLHAADVLLVPYADTPLGHSLAPLKTRELLATGRPVVATPLRGTADDAELAPHLRLASDAPSTLAAIDGALVEPPSAARGRLDAVATMSWASRAAVLDSLIADLARAPSGPSPTKLPAS